VDIPRCEQPCTIPGEVAYDETFPTDQREKLRVIDELMQRLVDRQALSEHDQFRYRLCLDEALENALKHGNGYDPTKSVRVVLFEDGDHWGVTITDEGTGFDPETIPNPSSEEGLLKEGGRGIFIMSQYMARVEYFDDGRTVLLQANDAES
jgi:serine/threonine-protein kinase RsbW